MKILPHLTDNDLQRDQDGIVRIQRADSLVMSEYGDAFHERAQAARAQYGVSVLVVCNVESDEVITAPLDWEGASNVMRLDASIYLTAKTALERADRDNETVVLIYRQNEDALSIYTFSPGVEIEND
ncbi:MAG: hypothetical protein O3A46_12895 [Candidatus Poribacteria bacterium]|nr:hypothetical protein [Candidatus Poribacteria bacterium]